MEIYRFAFIILLLSLLVSCGEKKQETGNADKAAEKKTPAFTLPEVPVMLQSVEDRLHFVVNSYDFSSYNKCIASRNDGYALILSIDL